MKTAQADPTRMKEMAPPPAPSPAPAPASPASPTAHKNHWWVYLILALVVAGFGYFIYTRLESAKAAGGDFKKGPAHDLPVVVAEVRKGDLNQYLVGLGTVTPLNTVTVKSRVDGAITAIHFVEGQRVKIGEPLIDIDPRPYEDALLQAKGQLLKDQAAEASADWSVQQDTIALKDNAIAQLQLHTDTATRDQARGAIEVDNAAIATAQLNITYSHITSPIDGVVGLRLVDLGNIVHAADTTGLVVLTQLQPITVVFTVAEDDIAQVQQRIANGQPIVVDAFDRDLVKKLATGKVIAVDNEIDPTTGTVKIKAQFDNKDNALYPSQFVNARMLVNTITDAVLVPSAAIQHSPSATFAYVLQDGKAGDKDQKSGSGGSGGGHAGHAAGGSGAGPKESRTVTIRDVVVGPSQPAVGADSEDTTVILSGLKPGDIVVTDGVDKLLEGTSVIPTFASSPTTQPVNSTTMPPTTRSTHSGHGGHGMKAEKADKVEKAE
jgi:multidrug efflux system membrane fusion protein